MVGATGLGTATSAQSEVSASRSKATECAAGPGRPGDPP